jgi:hypothetical protein
MRFGPTGVLLGWLLFPLLVCASTPGKGIDSVAQPAIVIIIDDVGDNWQRGEAAVALPGPVTYAVLPHSPFGGPLARQAYATGKEVMLHAPMANLGDRPLGPGALTSEMDRQSFSRVLEGDLATIPHAVGINNHMGSLLTRQRKQMAWVMELVRAHDLFFVDSRTTPDSEAWRVAREMGIPYLSRDVFLDHEPTTAFVHQQFMQTVAIARKVGFAVAIGHPYPVTIDYLARALPLLDEEGIRLVSASALVMEQLDQRRREVYARQGQNLQSSCDRQAGACDELLSAQQQLRQQPDAVVDQLHAHAQGEQFEGTFDQSVAFD